MKFFFTFILLLYGYVTRAEQLFTIKGHIKDARNAVITLKGYHLDSQKTIGQTTSDHNGDFEITYPGSYVGAAVLQIADMQSVILLLNHENFSIQWADLKAYDTLTYSNSQENNFFNFGLKLYQTTESKKTGLHYLIPLYANERDLQNLFKSEFKKQSTVYDDFIKALPENRYAKYYLQYRKLLNDIPLNLNNYNENIQTVINQFNTLDFKNPHLIQSGLLFEIIDSYLVLAESFGEKQYECLNNSTNLLLKSIGPSAGELKQEIAEHLFNSFEKRSLFPASEHLATTLLGDNQCYLDSRHKALFEQYRKMKIGNTAPDILLNGTNFIEKHLSEISSQYKLIVFGASWCPTCREEIPKLKEHYHHWEKKYNLEVVYISLDEHQEEHQSFSSKFPWKVSCDLKGWDSPAANDFSVFSTPTMYLLDNHNIILLKPIGFEQITAWLEVKNK